MASPLYYATILDKSAATVKVQLSIVHPDVSDFGTDRLFAWKLLAEYVSTPDDGSDVELASRYVKAVKLSPVKNAKVDATAADHFTVKRAGKKNPTVIYTIDLTDAALLADVSKGDSDEVYEYVEPGKGKKLTAPGKSPAAKPAAPATGPAKTYDDLRDAALVLLRKYDFWSDYVIEEGIFQRWTRGASEDDVVRWIGSLGSSLQAKAAALVAIDRLATDEASAKRFVKLAETKHRPKDSYNHYHSLLGLIPAWWRTGKTKQAEAGYKFLDGDMKKNGDDDESRAKALFTVAALGARWDLAAALAKHLGECDDRRLNPGIVAAFVAKQTKLFDGIMKRWSATEPSRKSSELSIDLLRLFLAEGKPERYLELVLAWPAIIDDLNPACYALSQVEARNPKLAVMLGDKLIANDDLHPNLHMQVLSTFVRHAPAKANAWATKNKRHLSEPSWLASFAAAGVDVKKRLARAMDSECCDIAAFSADRGLAVAAIERAVAAEREPGSYLLVRLADLTGRAKVDALLDKKLVEVGKLATKQRDLPCRALARAAATLGRPDIGFAAAKLPGPSLRRYTAGDMAAAAAVAGDFTTALAALQLIPDDDSNGRAGSAIQLLREIDEAFVTHDRAVPLRAIDATYVRNLIAAGARATIEAVLAIAPKGALTDDVRVEIDAFLEGRAFAPR